MSPFLIDPFLHASKQAAGIIKNDPGFKVVISARQSEIWFDLNDWWNFATELIEQRLDDYEFIADRCWFETKREQCDGCGEDFTYIKIFFPTASMDEFVEVMTPQIYAEWHGGEA